ncbi:MAG: TonB C-terminal domain-containing protein [Acidobacteria bacterium]|jgi:TonB family protein|nr:TonB C-terminal domain-containing protein [Acidobacteriota bacterium]
MKFKTTLALSVLLHASLAAVFIIHPAKAGSGGTTYYVDLVHLGGGNGPGGPGNGAGSGSPPAGAPGEPEAGATLVEEKAGSVKNLTVEKEFKSPLRYPDAVSRKKVEEEKMVSVVRKELPAAKSNPAVPGTPGGGLKTGISSGGAGGSGGGGGWGGTGPGGYFPHAYYIDLLRSRISSSWYSALVAPGLKGKYVTGVYFVIRRDGGISDLRLEQPSGIASLDLSARRAIENAAPFAPLPNDFTSPYLVVHFEFEWEKQ